MEYILVDAVAEVKDLVGKPLKEILCAVDGVGEITVSELAHLVADLIEDVVEALDRLEHTLGPKIKHLIKDVLHDVMYVALTHVPRCY